MENQPVNIHLAPGADTDKPIIIHLLEGESPKVNNPQKCHIAGDINAVMEYVAKRGGLLSKDTTVIYFSEQLKSISLYADGGNPLGLTIEAKLTPYPELQEFGINKQKFFSQTELEAHIKMRRIFFKDKDEHTSLLSNLRAFKAKIQAELQSVPRDTRGNQSHHFDKKVTTDLAAEFVLSIPLFKGSANSVFRVEICFDVTDSQSRFWLESVELFELEKDAVLKVFNEQKEVLDKLDYTVINC